VSYARRPFLATRQRGIVLAVLTTFGLAIVTLARSSLPAGALDAAASITEDELRPYIRFLASDELEGRVVGHSANEVAAVYLASAFERMGLEPAGTDGYYQAFDLQSFGLGAGSSVSIAGPRGGPARSEPGDDFYPLRESAPANLTAGVVAAGYGISVPDQHYDDYAGLDVSGKLVMVLAHGPREHDAEPRIASRLLTPSRKAETARRHGALGLLIVPDSAQHSGGDRLTDFRQVWPIQNSSQSRQWVLGDDFEASPLPIAMLSVHAANAALRNVVPGSVESVEAWQQRIDRALLAAGRTEAIAAPGSFALDGVSATLTIDVERATFPARNVLAMIEGSDPGLAREVVVVGAHLDHDGRDASGRIYNGADDDASGTAAVLEIAQAMLLAAEHGAPPRRTVLFALWNAEEKGSLGSVFYVRHPRPSGAEPIANLNLDMIGRSEEVSDPDSSRFRGLPRRSALESANVLHLLGYTLSPDLTAIVHEENSVVGLSIKTEYDGNSQNLLRRSDQWSFLERRIPALFFTTGLHPDYHTPDDDVDRINFRKMTRVARLVYQVAWRLADRTERPRYQDASPR
jgi:hypothetical protein